jgi:hypothetical protein
MTSAAPAATIHSVGAPEPVNARDPEFAWIVRSDVLELEDPALAFVAGAIVVEGAGGALVVES